MSNKKGGTLYIGVTNDLIRRVYEHKEALLEGFTNKYKLKMLVYYEQIDGQYEAISREKQLKKWNRAWKIQLIEKLNPDWQIGWFCERRFPIKLGMTEGVLV